MDYLKLAKKKRDERNVIQEHEYRLPIKDFLMLSYIRCEPNVYGNKFVKKLTFDLPILENVPKKLDLGDIAIGNKRYFECKISFGDENFFNLRNIRGYQNFDYFIICFVDTYKNFEPKFYCVPKEVITNNPLLHMSNMHGTVSANRKNTNILKSISIKKEDVETILEGHNLIKGTSYKRLLSFLKKVSGN